MSTTTTRQLAAQVHAGRPDEVGRLLATPGAIRTGHFQLLSGLHTDTFFAFSAIARQSQDVRQIARWMTPTVAPWDAGLILAPSTAGVTLATALAFELCLPLALSSLDSAGRAHGVLGDVDLSGQRVLIVNDVLTTGAGLRALSNTVVGSGGQVAGAAWFLSRAAAMPEGLPSLCHHVVTVSLPAWSQEQCALCAEATALEIAQDLN